MEETTPSLELRDIPDVSHMLPHEWWPWWAWVCVVTGVFLLWRVISWLQANSSQHDSLRDRAFEDARQALQEAKSHTTAVALSTALSLALRRYLTIAFADPSLFETHEEFLARHDAFAALPENIRHALSEHFSTLCRYKYTPSEEHVDLSLLAPQASALLHQIHAVASRTDLAAP